MEARDCSACRYRSGDMMLQCGRFNIRRVLRDSMGSLMVIATKRASVEVSRGIVVGASCFCGRGHAREK